MEDLPAPAMESTLVELEELVAERRKANAIARIRENAATPSTLSAISTALKTRNAHDVTSGNIGRSVRLRSTSGKRVWKTVRAACG